MLNYFKKLSILIVEIWFISRDDWIEVCVTKYRCLRYRRSVYENKLSVAAGVSSSSLAEQLSASRAVRSHRVGVVNIGTTAD